MTQLLTERTSQRLRAVAREYRQRGYEVVIAPQQDQLPSFLAEFRIDMLARNPKEHVVIEVRTSETLTDTPELDALANVLQHQPDWRLELIVTNPKDQTTRSFRNAQSLALQDIDYRLTEARHLAESEHGEAAFLLACSATEALLRHIAEVESVPLTRSQPSEVVKALFMHGSIDRDEYTKLQHGMQARETIIHGYKEPLSLSTTFTDLVHIVEGLQARFSKSSY